MSGRLLNMLSRIKKGTTYRYVLSFKRKKELSDDAENWLANEDKQWEEHEREREEQKHIVLHPQEKKHAVKAKPQSEDRA